MYNLHERVIIVDQKGIRLVRLVLCVEIATWPWVEKDRGRENAEIMNMLFFFFVKFIKGV